MDNQNQDHLWGYRIPLLTPAGAAGVEYHNVAFGYDVLYNNVGSTNTAVLH